MSVVYYDPERPLHQQPAFRSGEASRVVDDGEGGLLADERRVPILPNSAHALIGHGVVDALNALSPEAAAVGSGRDALFPPAACPDLAALFYAADRRTYGPRWSAVEFVVGRGDDPPVEFRIAIDNREYQRTLSRLQYLATTAGRHGQGVRIRI